MKKENNRHGYGGGHGKVGKKMYRIKRMEKRLKARAVPTVPKQEK